MEISHSHFAGEKEGDRTGEQPKKKQGSAEHFVNAADPYLGQERRCAVVGGHSNRKGEELHCTRLYKHERTHDTEYAAQVWGRCRPFELHLFTPSI